LQNVEFFNNQARFLDPYHFRVTFECIAPLKDDLEWKLIYVSSPGNEELDQELDDCLVGPVPVGVNSFEFEGLAPDPAKIPTEDVLGVAALILTGSYRDQEFVRVGYYQNTEYDNEDMKATPPEKIQFDRLVRDISTKLRVTRFQIKWFVLFLMFVIRILIHPKGRRATITRSRCCRGCSISRRSLCQRPRW
ncbi:ASF1 like histone chaperone-domain-containing protein, partial [Suillus occidentalis]